MPTVKLSSKGQIAIPKDIREKLRLKKDMNLQLTVEKDRIVLKPLGEGAWLRLEGVLKGTKVLEELEAEHRAEIEKGD